MYATFKLNILKLENTHTFASIMIHSDIYSPINFSFNPAGCLKSPHVTLQSLLKIYTIFLAPFINPLVASYFRVWKFMAQLFGLAIKIMIYISRILFR